MEVDLTVGLSDYVHYNEEFIISSFVISRSHSIHFTVILAGLMNIVCYFEDLAE